MATKILFGALPVGSRCTTESEQHVIKTREVSIPITDEFGEVTYKITRNAANLETGDCLFVDSMQYVWVKNEEPVIKEVLFGSLPEGETCETEYNEKIMKMETIRIELRGGPDYRNAVNLTTGALMFIDADQKVKVVCD